MKAFVIGSINMDLVIKAPYTPSEGETISGSDFMSNPGGKGANQAVALSKLGANTFMVGCVGKAFGRELIETLNGYNVNTKYVQTLNNISSGVAVITIVNGDNSIILDAGSNGCVSKDLVDEALNDSNPGDFVVLQQEIPEEIVFYALKKAKEKELVTVLNPAPARKIDEKVFEFVDYFIPNQSETKFYTGIYPDSDESINNASKELQKKGIKNVLITLGTKGSIAITNNEVIRVDAHKVNAIDTTAAGDTYCGALVSRLMLGHKLKDAMEFASLASSITVTRKGAQQSIPYLKEVK